MNRPDFIKTDTGLVPLTAITYIADGNMEAEGYIEVHHSKGCDRITGFFALEALMIVKPSALEGQRLRWHKNAWLLHNVVAHPAMQFMAIAAGLTRPFSHLLSMKLYKVAMQVHDATVPVPIGFRFKPIQQTRKETPYHLN